MYELTEQDLREIGINHMVEPARSKLVEGIQQNINDRILIALADLITDEKNEELEGINESADKAGEWLKANLPNYASAPDYELFKEVVGEEHAEQLYAQNKWFETNIPTLPAVSQQTARDVIAELKTISRAVPIEGEEYTGGVEQKQED